MRKHIPFLSLVLILACLVVARPAPAETFTGNNGVTVTVPKSWTAEYEAPNMQILLASPLEDCAVSVQLLPNNGNSAEKFSKIFSQRMNGTSPEKLYNGSYTFDAFFQGVPLTATVYATHDKAVVLMELGDVDGYPDELQLIRNSLRGNDPDTQTLLDVFK